MELRRLIYTMGGGLIAMGWTWSGYAAVPAIAWDGIELDGAQIGHITTEVRPQGDEIFTEERLQIELRLAGKRELIVGRSLWVEGIDGRPRRFQSSSGSGRSATHVEMRVLDDEIAIVQRGAGTSRRSRLPVTEAPLFPRALAARMHAAASTAGAPASFVGVEFDTQALVLEKIRYTVVAPAPGDEPGLQRWQRRVFQGDQSDRTSLQWDPAGERFIRPLSVAGLKLKLRRCPAACTVYAVGAVDLIDELLRPAPYRIPKALLTEQLRFVLRPRSGVLPRIPETGEQSVVQGGERAVITICSECGRETAPTAEELQRYLLPNAWVQSDHQRIRRLARSARGGRGDLATRMTRLSRLVQQEMTGEVLLAGYVDAVAALDARSGDCTEFAVLLAALARAEDIPTRVVAGMAYSARFTGRSHVFSPHAWVQVWNGTRWQSFDAGLGRFDSGHIVLAIGDGRPDDYAGVLNSLRNLDVVDAGRVAPGAAK